MILTISKLLLSLLFFSINTFISLSNAQVDIGAVICQRYGQASATIGKRVYYDGGWVSKTPEKRAGDAERSTNLLAIDVSKSWKAKEVKFEIVDADSPVTHLSENNILFSSQSSLFQYGFYHGPPEGFQSWSINTNISTPGPWRSSKVNLQDIKVTSLYTTDLPIANAGYTQSDDGQRGYTVGGSNGEFAFSSMVLEYQLSGTNGGKEIRNKSQLFLGEKGITKGSLVWFPGGIEGALISIGGIQEGNINISPETVAVFDIRNKIWYMQPTTGSAPSSLVSGSAVIISAPDKSSYSIYITNTSGLYILSIPSFTWYKLKPPEKNAPWYRERPSVNIVGQRQMLFAGGQNGEDCDTQPAYVFDMTTLQWQESFTPNAEQYEIPELVWTKIGGSGKGGSRMLAPENGWIDSKLGDIFENALSPTDNALPEVEVPTPTDNGTETTNTRQTAGPISTVLKDIPAGRKPPAGIIAGAVIGGIGALLIIFFLWLLVRSNVKKRELPESRAETIEEGKDVLEPPAETTLHELQAAGENYIEPVYEMASDTDWRDLEQLSPTESNERYSARNQESG